jgi:hypothetical protein
MDEKYISVKSALSGLCGVPPHLLRLAEVSAAQIKVCIYLEISGNYILDDHASMIVYKYRLSACKYTGR